MAEPIFNAGIDGRNVVAAPYASNGGANNFYFANDGPSKPCKPFSTVPFPPDPDFVERPRITAWLREKCSRPASRAALVGLGGIGKSQLAVHYAQEIRQGSPSTYVFWVHAGTKERFEEAYVTIANRLQLPGRNDPNVDAVRLVYDWLCTEENGPWLMVLDNADDADVFYSKPNRVQSVPMASKAHQPLASFLPQSSNGMILVTSRSRDVAERLTGSSRNVLSIEAMDEHQAQQLLRSKLQEMYDEDVVPELLQALEYMPLAITQAATYILRRAPRMSPSTYLGEFRRNEKKKSSLLNKDMGDLRRDPSASNSVVTTWQITFDNVRQERQSAADLLAFLSFFNPQGIPEWVVRSYQRSTGDENEAIIKDSTRSSSDDQENDSSDDSEGDEFEEDLNMLREFSLVRITTQKGVLEMHALVQFCTQIWLSSFDNVAKWRQRFLQVISREYQPGEFDNWAKYLELGPHIEQFVRKEPENKEDTENFIRLLRNVGWYKWRMGKHEEAEQLSRRALEASEKVLGKEHPTTLTSVSNLALVLRHQGKYKEAEQMNRWTLEASEKTIGKEHPDTLTSVSNLAMVLRYQGKYKEAEQLNQRALDGREKVLGKEHPDTLTGVSNLASVLQHQGKYREAEQMNQRALEALEKVLGKEHPDTLTSVSNLAIVLRYQGKYEEAEQLNRRALDGREKVLGKEHPDTLSSVWNLAYFYLQQNRLGKANELYNRAWYSYIKVLGTDHPNTIMCGRQRFSLREEMGL
ncbi:TPR domain protein [Colletotrichum tofieldiae]|uniref:TPR domain protein (Kinesin light chain) n=1 Tax=Colletotrichum tofieldiae TaxID=708197 RepID=A0A166VVC2_9PEZI|nr:TPR domain protein (kinesin light chain) [Colletotrichum tofieldiae]GKT66818.1 TPR domain protein [Colletotrichum tofieldiae]GKT71885.1 TPR domain protein [Colletotrichum tofieldiae]GKT94930.1 TPR domain protein [Colletotrichum tofieldiae]